MRLFPSYSNVNAPRLGWGGRVFFGLLGVCFLAAGGFLLVGFALVSREDAAFRREGVRVSASIDGGVTWWTQTKRDGSFAGSRFDFTVVYQDGAGVTHREKMSASEKVFSLDLTGVLEGGQPHAPSRVDIVYLPESPGRCRLATDLDAGETLALVMVSALLLLGGGVWMVAVVVRSLNPKSRIRRGEREAPASRIEDAQESARNFREAGASRSPTANAAFRWEDDEQRKRIVEEMCRAEHDNTGSWG